MTTVLARLYDAMCMYLDCRQRDRTVDAYAEEFQTLYDRVLMIIPPTTDPVKKEEQRKMLIIVYFLRGLKPELGPARTRVLNRTPAPTYDEVVVEMKRYEAYLEESVLACAREGSGNGGRFSNGGGRSRLARSHGYTRDACYYPNSPKGNDHGSCLVHCT